MKKEYVNYIRISKGITVFDSETYEPSRNLEIKVNYNPSVSIDNTNDKNIETELFIEIMGKIMLEYKNILYKMVTPGQ